MKQLTILFCITLVVLFAVSTQSSFAHCQIPCGIYDDEARFTELLEHCTTIEKSMNEINRLSTEADKNYNQIVRWVNSKEDHADKLTDIIVDYFMVQRVKEVSEDDAGYVSYIQKITLLHKIIRLSMACKQTADSENVMLMRKAIEDFKIKYTVK